MKLVTALLGVAALTVPAHTPGCTYPLAYNYFSFADVFCENIDRWIYALYIGPPGPHNDVELDAHGLPKPKATAPCLPLPADAFSFHCTVQYRLWD